MDLASIDAPLGSTIRRWSVAGLGACLGFAAYIALLPFHFDLVNGGSLLRLFAERVELHVGSRTNLIANVVLFVPMGLFGAALISTVRLRRVSVWVAYAALLVTAAICSLGIEVLQVLVPTRTPSLVDVMAQVIGTATGIGIWMFVRRDIEAWSSTRAPSSSIDAMRGLLWCYAVGRSIALVLPLDVTVNIAALAEKYRRGGIVLNPSAILSAPDAVQTIAADAVLAVPIGVLACRIAGDLRVRRPVTVAVIAGTVWCLSVEAAQLLVMSRTVDVADVLVGAVGVWIGARAATARESLESDDREVPAFSPWALAGLAASLAAFAVYNLSPFDFTRPADAAARVSMLFRIPFHSYYDSPDLVAVDGAVLKTLLGVPVGLFAGMLTASVSARFPRVTSLMVMVSGVAFFGAVEAAQVLLPSRYPDSTDVLVATGGLAIGLLAVRAAQRRQRPAVADVTAAAG